MDLLPTACPRCGAGVRADAPWCTQCFLNLRTPEPAPVVAAAPAAPAAPAQREPVAAAYGPLTHVTAAAPGHALDPLTAPLHALTGESAAPPARHAAPEAAKTWPCTACGTENGFEVDHCAACGQGFLASLSGDLGSFVVPGVGDLVTMSKGKRIGVALGAVLALMLLITLVGLVL